MVDEKTSRGGGYTLQKVSVTCTPRTITFMAIAYTALCTATRGKNRRVIWGHTWRSFDSLHCSYWPSNSHFTVS